MDDFGEFLNWLDPDRERAGAKYEDIRRKLNRFFISRGCGVESDTLVDETIERIIKKIHTLVDSYQGDPVHYFFGVARNVYREWLHAQIRQRDWAPLPSGDSAEEKEQMDQCLQSCMKGHTESERTLIIEYYCGDKQEKIENRRKLAEELGIAPNALRIRAHRIRTELRKCMEQCLEQDEEDKKV